MPIQKLSPAAVRIRRKMILDKISDLQQQVLELHRRCSHAGEINFHADPSGNGDSEYLCSTCGSSWRRLPSDVPVEGS